MSIRLGGFERPPRTIYVDGVDFCLLTRVWQLLEAPEGAAVADAIRSALGGLKTDLGKQLGAFLMGTGELPSEHFFLLRAIEIASGVQSRSQGVQNPL